jgi:hypothetical protein
MIAAVQHEMKYRVPPEDCKHFLLRCSKVDAFT